MVTLFVTKILYYGYMIVLPYMLLPITWWQLAIGFLIVHFTAGVILGIIFQLAHVVEETEHPTENEEGNIENAWMSHQMETTSNFSHGNKLLCWYIGGLNYHETFGIAVKSHYETLKKFGNPGSA